MFILYIITAALGISVFFGSFIKAKGNTGEQLEQNLPWFFKLITFIGLSALCMFLSIAP